jgi:HAD superfamily hydrolase (TIGR01509 family)
MATSPVSRGVLWDLDGTLIDSAEAHYVAWRETLAERGHEHSREEFFRGFGKRNDLVLRAIFGDALAPEEAERLADVKEKRYRRHVREHGVELCAGATDWLTRLREEGFRQALATSAPPENVTVVVEVLGLERYIDATASARDVERGKPDPAIFLEAARRIGVPPERCVVMEDTPPGLEGARRAGMRSVGLLSPHHRELEADVVVGSLTELAPDVFDELLGP